MTVRRNFYEERRNVQGFIEECKRDVEYHRERLASFEKQASELSTDTSAVVGEMLGEQVLAEKATIERVVRQIKFLERYLQEKYSLAPAN